MFEDNAVSAAFGDLAQGVRLAPLWWRLVLEQTVGRYRRTLLGPFWLASSTLSTGFALSIVFGTIFGGRWRDTFPFVLSGVMCFGFVSGAVVEASQTFLNASGLMQIRKLPLSFHSFLQMDRVLINFAHQIVAFWIVTLCLGMLPLPHWQLIFAIPVILMIGFALSMPLGMISTRYRDVNYLIGFIMSSLFMLTPVFWKRSQMRQSLRWIVDYNPLAHMLEILRQPILGHPAPFSDWAAALFILAVSALIALVCLVFFRRRVVFWL